jgi:hypothetical protein
VSSCAGHRAHRFGASSETAEQLQVALESSEIAAAAMSARLRLPDVEEKDQPKRRPIPDHVPRVEVELSPQARRAARVVVGHCARSARRRSAYRWRSVARKFSGSAKQAGLTKDLVAAEQLAVSIPTVVKRPLVTALAPHRLSPLLFPPEDP